MDSQRHITWNGEDYRSEQYEETYMKRIFRRLGFFIKNKYLLIIVLSLALIVPSIFGAVQLETKTGRDTFVSPDHQVSQDLDKFQQHFSGEVIIILFVGDDLTQLLQPGIVTSMETLEDQMNENQLVVSAVGPAFLIKQAVEQQTVPEDAAQLQAIVIDSESGQIRSEFRQFFPDDEHAFIAVTLDAGLSWDEGAEVIEEIEDVIAGADFEGIETIVTGSPVFGVAIADSLGSSMRNMLILSIGLMLLILALVFSVRGFFAWRWMPLGAVLIAVIYTFGVMGVLSIPITIVTMSVFPILIGLGVDYAIQFHNRYDEEAKRGETAAGAIIDSVTHIGPTIGIAIMAGCLGFAALFFSPVPMIQDFGFTLIIGVIACYLVSVFFLLAILYSHDRRVKPPAESDNRNTNAKKKKGMHVVDKGLRRLAPWVLKNPAIILPIAVLLCVGGLIADSHIETEFDEMKFVSQDMPVIRDLRTAESILGGVKSANLLVEAEDVTDPAILTWMVELEQQIAEEQPETVAGISSVADLVAQAYDGTVPQDSQVIGGILEAVPVPIKRNLVTDDYTAANVTITLPELTADQMEELKVKLTGYVADHPEGLEVTVTGMSIFKIEVRNALTSGRLEMTLIGIAMVFGGLFLLFKFNVIRALIAIIPIGLILGWSSGIMYLLGVKYTPFTATLGALIIGIGVEFTVLLMMRYYEERSKGEGAVEAMTTAITRIGRAVIASGLTVIGGFGALLIAMDFPIIQDFGIVTMINVFFALVSTLLVLSTLIVLVDRWRERPKAKRLPRLSRSER
ncbi:RND family transporter [Chloroflexota bacterium]